MAREGAREHSLLLLHDALHRAVRYFLTINQTFSHRSADFASERVITAPASQTGRLFLSTTTKR